MESFMKFAVSLLQCLLLATCLKTAHSFSSGAPGAACSELSPVTGHGPSTATGSAPYVLELSQTDYQPGDIITGTLRGESGAQFKGFAIAARSVDCLTCDSIGPIVSSGSTQFCPGALGNAITHSDPSLKDSVGFTWTAPSTAQGDIVFRYTVLRNDAQDYFTGLTSTVITGPPLMMRASFVQDTACGVSKGCYSDCDGTDCTWESTWMEAGDDYNITLKSIFDGSEDKYVALGFSTSPAMAQASVVACVANGGTVRVAGSYNPGYSNTPLADPNEGLSNQVTSYADGVLSCSFSRSKISTDPQMYNLTEPWYIITARGSTAADGTLQQHASDSRYATTSKVDLTTVTIDERFGQRTTPNPVTPRTTASSTVLFPKDTECGNSKGCYSDCGTDGCRLLLSWSPFNDTHFDFGIEAVYTGTDNHYVALGFSTQDKMDKASVVACTYISGVVDVFASFNPGYYNQPLANPKEGLSNIKGSIDSGVMKCTFTRVKVAASNNEIFDLARPWYLIVAEGGAAAGGILLEHNNQDRYLTTYTVDFNDITLDIDLETLDYPLVQAHACLMIIAWMLSGSMGIAFAKFFKRNWSDRTIMGVKVWFAVHRFCMPLVLIMSAVALVVIFIEIEGYSDIPGATYKKAHPILGLVVTGLMLCNMLMSFFRCAPDHAQRWVYNWSHWAVGHSAHIMAGVTISLGMYLPKSQMDKDAGLLVMIIYGVWHVIYGVSSGVLHRLSLREECRVGDSKTHVELFTVAQAPSSSPHNVVVKGEHINSASHLVIDPLKSQEPPFSGAKKALLLIHFILLTAMTTFLVVLIIDGE